MKRLICRALYCVAYKLEGMADRISYEVVE